MIIFLGCKEPAKYGGFGEIPEVRQDLSSSDIIQNETKNDELISNLLLEELNKSYLTGECGAEGHIILGQEIKGEKTVYMYFLWWEIMVLRIIFLLRYLVVE